MFSKRGINQVSDSFVQRPKATCTDVHPAHFAIDNHTLTLNIGLELTL
jgi:hypothetical protein